MRIIVKAGEKGKIKIRKVENLTADKVEIRISLAPGVSSDKTIDALYAFTNCEVSISPNCCVSSTWSLVSWKKGASKGRRSHEQENSHYKRGRQEPFQKKATSLRVFKEEAAQ